MTWYRVVARLTAVAAFLVVFASARRVSACRCLEPKSAATAYGAAHAVVAGKVIEVTRPRPDETEVTVEVAAVWKADMPKLLRVTTSTDCAFPFQSGNDYLLFLYQDSSAAYSTERCMGNREKSKAATFLAWLKKNGREGTITSTPGNTCEGNRR